MVFFTCDACGESLKKAQVEKHYKFKCRSCSVLTCVDCQKDFPGDAYIQHTKCITEDEKYGGKNYQPKANANKGLKKQNAWIENLQEVVAAKAGSLDADVKSVVDTIITFENIPRKKPKFMNFAKNVLGGGRRSSPQTLEKTWELLQEALKKPEQKEPETKEEEPVAKKLKVEEPEKTEEEVPKSSKKDKKKSKKKDKAEKESENTKTEQKDGGSESDCKTCETATNGAAEPEEEEEEEVCQGVKKFKGTGKKRKGDSDVTATPVKKEKVASDEESKSSKQKKSKTQDDTKKFDWESAAVAVLEKKGSSMKESRLNKKAMKAYWDAHPDERLDADQKHKLEAKMTKRLKKSSKLAFEGDSVSLVGAAAAAAADASSDDGKDALVTEANGEEDSGLKAEQDGKGSLEEELRLANKEIDRLKAERDALVEYIVMEPDGLDKIHRDFMMTL